MIRKYLFLTTILISILITGCNFEGNPPNADMDQQRKTEKSMREANKQVGMPAIVNFQEKKLMKQIYELRDQENLICFAYYIDMTGVKHFLGKCIGYGLPYSTQFSNPEKVFHDSGINGRSATFIPQPEPNGLFMPEGLSATWLLLIDPATNEARPVYIESEILVSPFRLH